MLQTERQMERCQACAYTACRATCQTVSDSIPVKNWSFCLKFYCMHAVSDGNEHTTTEDKNHRNKYKCGIVHITGKLRLLKMLLLSPANMTSH